MNVSSHSINKDMGFSLTVAMFTHICQDSTLQCVHRITEKLFWTLMCVRAVL